MKPRKSLLLAGYMLALSACASPPGGTLREGAAARESCDEAGAQRFIGQPATAELGSAILDATGARIFEWIPPDRIVTLAFSPTRVRVSYDRAFVITEVRCG